VIVIKQDNLLDILSAFRFAQIPCELPVIIVKQAVHDVPEEKNEPPEERALLCENIWSEILVSLTISFI